MTHREKVSLARKLRTPAEAKQRIGIFDSQGWMKRSDAILARVLRREAKQQVHKKVQIMA